MVLNWNYNRDPGLDSRYQWSAQAHSGHVISFNLLVYKIPFNPDKYLNDSSSPPPSQSMGNRKVLASCASVLRKEVLFETVPRNLILAALHCRLTVVLVETEGGRRRRVVHVRRDHWRCGFSGVLFQINSLSRARSRSLFQHRQSGCNSDWAEAATATATATD